MVRREPLSQRRGGCRGRGGSRSEDEQKEFLQNYMVCKNWFGQKMLVTFQRGYSDYCGAFQVPKTSESCGELRGQEDAKWDLRRTRYGGICLPSQCEFCVCTRLFTNAVIPLCLLFIYELWGCF